MASASLAGRKSTRKEFGDALDNLCDSTDSVAVRAGELIYLGGFIHILLLIAVVVLILQLVQGRRPVV